MLVDFWTYSCINCLRTLPQVNAWDAEYRDAGLSSSASTRPSSHSSTSSRTSAGRARHGVRYPVALDNDYKTWNAYSNQYWPADYVIDRNGRVRDTHFGEGAYAETERRIQRLLGRVRAAVVDRCRRHDAAGSHDTRVVPRRRAARALRERHGQAQQGGDLPLPHDLNQNDLAYAGRWRVEVQRIVAARDARLRLHFHAQHVYLVLGGRGTVRALVNGRLARTVRVSGAPRLYTILDLFKPEDAILGSASRRASPATRSPSARHC